MKTIVLTFIVICMPLMSYAHEGHDKTPGALPLDGFDQIQATDHLYLKLKMEKEGVKIFPFDHDNKPVALQEVKIEGSATFPKKPKAEKLTFASEDSAFSTKIDAKGAHRYTLDITVTHQGKKEKVKFNVEPQ